MTNTPLTRHVRNSVLLAASAAVGMLFAYQVVRADTLATQVQTVDVDLGQPSDVVTNRSQKSPVDGQLLMLGGLAVLGILGIVGVVKDVRRGHA